MKKVILLLLAITSLKSFSQSIKADGVTDDLSALNYAVKQCKDLGYVRLVLPNGVIRITDTWKIGGKPFEETEYNVADPISHANEKGTAEFQVSKFTLPLQIVGSGNTCIYADFNDTGKLKAAVYISTLGVERFSQYEQSAAEFSNIGIYAKGYFINGKPTGKVEDYSKNNCIGLISFYTTSLTMNKVLMIGFKIGLVLNNSYDTELRNLQFKYCGNSFYHFQSHTSNISILKSYMCKKGGTIASDLVTIDDLYSGYCDTGLEVVNGSCNLNNLYFENNNCKLGTPQLIIGIDSGTAMKAVRLTNLTIGAVVKGAGNYATGIELKNTAREVLMEGGNVQSVYIKYPVVNPLCKLITTAVRGQQYYPAAITKINL
jgi:hypothetical protein